MLNPHAPPPSLRRTLLSRGSLTTLYLQTGPEGQAVLKLLNDDGPSPLKLARFQNELTITSDLHIPGVRRPIRKERADGRYALLLEYAKGEPLRASPPEGRKQIEEVLRIALRVAQILGELHRRRVVHRDLKPKNLIFDPGSQSLTVIDFGLATAVDLKLSSLGSPRHLEGTLAYMSPEQTGRMNRVVDHRADLYSLGATIYELLTGAVPFESSDPLEVVHHHLAVAPVPPHKVNGKVPEPLSDIVLKLLAKNADDRYQSAFGLAHDLGRCLELLGRTGEGRRLETTGAIERFQLAERDAPGRVQILHKLYGREAEAAALLAAFERASAGAPELVLVTGSSGVGKSALVSEVYRALGEKRGTFLQGKFDELERNVPYHAPAQAFRGLVDQLLAEDEGTLASIRGRILAAVGGLGKVLASFVPGIERLLGPQPEVPQLAGAEAKNRFAYVLRSFLRAVSPPEHPLVLFLDDLHWADAASRQLLADAFAEGGSGHFLIAGAYRDGEVGAAHPLTALVFDLRKRGVRVSTLHLGALSADDVRALVEGALRDESQPARDLAALVFEKTEGNAFFVRQFLASLEERKLLTFDFGELRFRWDLAEVRRLGTTDNVIDLLVEKMSRLPAGAAKVLPLAACVGARFDLETLSLVDGRSARATGADLLHAVEEGLVTPLGGSYGLVGAAAGIEGLEDTELAFAHDRIQQAAYSLLPEGERRAVHRRVGRLLLERTPAEARPARVFEIVNQLNLAGDEVASASERDELAALNLEAGRRAAQAVAFRLALDYLRAGHRLLGDDGWRRDYPRMLALRSEAAEAAYLSGEYAESAVAAREVLSRARHVLDKEKAYYSLLMAAIIENRAADAVAVGLEALSLLGVTFPGKPGMHHVAAALLETKLALGRKPVESLESRPAMTDSRILVAMYFIERMCPAAYRTGSKLFPLLLLRMVTLSLRHGNMPVTSFACVSYALMLCGILGDLDGGYRFGELSRRLVEHFGVVGFVPKVEFCWSAFVAHWKRPLAETLPAMNAARQVAVEIGSVFDAGSLASYAGTWMFLAGEPLPQVERYLATQRDVCARGGEWSLQMANIVRQVVANLAGEARSGDGGGASGGPEPPPLRLAGKHFDESASPAFDEAKSDKTELCFFHAQKLFLASLFGDARAGLMEVAACEKHLEGLLGLPLVPFVHFHTALVRLEALRAEPGRRDLARGVKKSLSLFRKWAHHEPKNQLHRLRLLEAEDARRRGDDKEARERYAEAIEAARASGCLQEEALAFELASRFHGGRGHTVLATTLLERAAATYRQWGAGAKVTQLLGKDQRLSPTLSTRLTATTRTTTEDAGALDLASLMKASAAISGEIVMDRLLRRLTGILLENAGAERGAVLLRRDEELFVAAESSAEGGVTVGQWVPLDRAAGVCEAVARYVARAGEPLVLRDASAEGNFQKTPYVVRHRVRSVLCLPIKHQGKLGGVLYLENNLVAGAFTEDRCRVLDLLSSQAAIALENARLYATLDQRVTERTAELRRTNEDLSRAIERLKETQKQLVVQEKLASLGALTSGIAHEIKNPLNFINNFSEVSVDLVDELLAAFEEQKGRLDGAATEAMAEILGDLRENVARINEHGRRTDGIVRSMLEHARIDTGEKRETDLNALVAEYATLAYHGMRSRDPSSEIVIEGQYDPTLAPVTLAPRDLGRVFLNLVNNACYAAGARAKGEGAGFVPRVTLSTRNLGEHVEVRVRDNGAGIPEGIRDRVFNPFFTTKPAGEGTGLGLSISHDIVVQGSAGTLRFETEEGRGTDFIVTLPLGGG